MHVRVYVAVVCLALAVPWSSAIGASNATNATSTGVVPAANTGATNVTTNATVPATVPTNGTVVTAANCTLDSNDVLVLNYLLTLERLESAFFTDGLQMFGSNATNATSATSMTAGAGAKLNSTAQQLVSSISGDETAHVASLVSALNNSNCQVNPECTFDFSKVTSAETFLQTGQTIENNIAAAYVGVSDRIRAADLRLLIASIAVVEGRHAAVMNQLVGAAPSTSAFNDQLSPQAAVDAFQPFIVRCPVTPAVPLIVNCSSASERGPGSDDARNPVGESYHMTTAFVEQVSAAPILSFGGYLIASACAVLLLRR